MLESASLAHKNPTFYLVFTFVGLLLEQRELEVYHPQLVGELFHRALLRQDDIRAELLLKVYWGEAQESHQRDRSDLIVPCRTSLALTGYGLRDIVYAPVLEEWLRLVLHLHDDLFAFVRFAIDVVNQRPVFLKQCGLFLVEKGQVGDMLFTLEQTVEEVEQQRFRQLLSEDSIETDVGERINVFCHIFLFCWQR